METRGRTETEEKKKRKLKKKSHKIFPIEYDARSRIKTLRTGSNALWRLKRNLLDLPVCCAEMGSCGQKKKKKKNLLRYAQLNDMRNMCYSPRGKIDWLK